MDPLLDLLLDPSRTPPGLPSGPPPGPPSGPPPGPLWRTCSEKSSRWLLASLLTDCSHPPGSYVNTVRSSEWYSPVATLEGSRRPVSGLRGARAESRVDVKGRLADG
eukprot:1178818-Prorocentrum_minimum.AAC.1